ncbi:hypothetical protein HK100_003028 [Physocladia obscura]|uniref:Glycoside hydrolase family 19 catalytic domain-containing protein n=1 Tax=Physocladia obscura TaxID=109957 RepID=A0AAD5SXG7_9FUNG|nr:hypothetical protein HK100_003028 [Physocladia obscura]
MEPNILTVTSSISPRRLNSTLRENRLAQFWRRKTKRSKRTFIVTVSLIIVMLIAIIAIIIFETHKPLGPNIGGVEITHIQLLNASANCFVEADIYEAIQAGFVNTPLSGIKELAILLGNTAFESIQYTQVYQYGCDTPELPCGLYYGRGYIQLTGIENYNATAIALHRPDILTNPDIVAEDNVTDWETVAFYWKNRVQLFFEKDGVSLSTSALAIDPTESCTAYNHTTIQDGRIESVQCFQQQLTGTFDTKIGANITMIGHIRATRSDRRHWHLHWLMHHRQPQIYPTLFKKYSPATNKAWTLGVLCIIPLVYICLYALTLSGQDAGGIDAEPDQVKLYTIANLALSALAEVGLCVGFWYVYLGLAFLALVAIAAFVLAVLGHLWFAQAYGFNVFEYAVAKGTDKWLKLCLGSRILYFNCWLFLVVCSLLIGLTFGVVAWKFFGDSNDGRAIYDGEGVNEEG